MTDAYGYRKYLDMKYRARPLIEAFGGLSKAAKALGHANVTTVQYWRDRDTLPDWRLRELQEAADREGITLPEPVEYREAI